MAIFIRLTRHARHTWVRVNVDHLTTYSAGVTINEKDVTYVSLLGFEDSLIVEETPEQIDALIAAN